MNLLLLHTYDDPANNKPRWDESQFFAYSRWAEICLESGIKLYRGALNHFDSEGFFTNIWEHVGNQKWERKKEKIFIDVIYDKSRSYNPETGKISGEAVEKKQAMSQRIRLVNSLEFSLLFGNKLNQAAIFAEYVSPTKLITKGSVLQVKDKPIVIKSYFGLGGKQVKIISEGIFTADKDYLQQEFIDAKNEQGEIRDIRVEFIDGVPQFAFSRIAPKGSFHTNMALGAGIEYVDLNQISEVLDLCNRIAKPMRIFPESVYSLDFMYDFQQKKYFLIEMNTMPGISGFDESSRVTMESYLQNLTNALAN